LVLRIGKFPVARQVVVEERVNTIELAPVEDFLRDSDLFLGELRNPWFPKQNSSCVEGWVSDKRLGNEPGSKAD
jgi:hypothetical protein